MKKLIFGGIGTIALGYKVVTLPIDSSPYINQFWFYGFLIAAGVFVLGIMDVKGGDDK